MHSTTAVGFIEMRIAKVVGYGPPLAEEDFQCVVLDEVSGDRHLVIEIGTTEAFWLAAQLAATSPPPPATASDGSKHSRKPSTATLGSPAPS
jgi:hypothetical protein